MNKAVWILLLTYISHVCACRYREEQQHQRRKWRRNSSKAAEENTPDMDNLLLMKENCVLCMVGLWLIRAPELKRKVSLLILLPWVCWWLLLFPNIRKTAVPYSERGSFFWASHAAEKKSTHEFGAQPGLNCSSSLSCKKWSLNVIPLNYWTRWQLRLSEMDEMEMTLRVWFNDRKGTVHTIGHILFPNTGPFIHSFFPSFHLHLLHALLQPGPGCSTKDTSPGLLEGSGRSYISAWTANH